MSVSPLRGLGREADARQELGNASIDGRLLPDASAALADPTYGPVMTTAAAIAARTSRWDPQSGPTPEELRRTQQAATAKTVLAEADRELETFVGLAGVKSHIITLKGEQVYDRVMAARGEQVGEPNAMHVTLVGPPGTAKTSIARILGRMYFGLGLLESPDFIEVSKKDLVGDRIGQTEAKTGEILDKARGRSLFIDEAPELYQPDNERDFVRIALDIIMKYAEDHRSDIMIAMAGYAGGMNQLLSANPGLRGRFPNQLEFHSYSPEELGQIAARLAAAYRIRVATEAVNAFDQVARWLTSTPTGNPKDPTETLIDIANNGRYVRNVMGEAVKTMKARLASDAQIDLATADLTLATTVTEHDMTTAMTAVLAAAGIATR